MEQLAEDVATLAEAEFEKRSLSAAWKAESPGIERTAAYRSLRFVADGQLDLLTSVAHLVTNLCAKTIARHPRWFVVDYTALSADAQRFALDADGKNDHWCNANAGSLEAVTEMAASTNDAEMDALAKALWALNVPEWAPAIRLRGARHHKAERSGAEGVAHLPPVDTGDVIGVVMGRFHATYLGPNGTIDAAEAAVERLEQVCAASSAVMEKLGTALASFLEAWRAADEYLADPTTEPIDWSSDFTPEASANGRPFPYLIRFHTPGMTPEAARTLAGFHRDPVPGLAVFRTAPDVCEVTVFDQDFGSAKRRAEEYFATIGADVAGSQAVSRM